MDRVRRRRSSAGDRPCPFRQPSMAGGRPLSQAPRSAASTDRRWLGEHAAKVWCTVPLSVTATAQGMDIGVTPEMLVGDVDQGSHGLARFPWHNRPGAAASRRFASGRRGRLRRSAIRYAELAHPRWRRSLRRRRRVEKTKSGGVTLGLPRLLAPEQPRDVAVLNVGRHPWPAVVLPHGEDATLRAGAVPRRPFRERTLARPQEGASAARAGKQGRRGDPSRRRTVDSVEMRTFGQEEGWAAAVGRVLRCLATWFGAGTGIAMVRCVPGPGGFRLFFREGVGVR